MANQNKRLKIFALVVSVLFVLALGYIGISMYSSWNQANQLGFMQYGYNQAILSIAQQAGPGSCQQVPLIVGNQTINVIAVECLTTSPTG